MTSVWPISWSYTGVDWPGYATGFAVVRVAVSLTDCRQLALISMTVGGEGNLPTLNDNMALCLLHSFDFLEVRISMQDEPPPPALSLDLSLLAKSCFVLIYIEAKFAG